MSSISIRPRPQPLARAGGHGKAPRAEAARAGLAPLVYWLNPITVMAIVFALSLLCFAAIPESVFQFEFRQPKYPVAEVTALYLFIWAALSGGMMTAQVLMGRTAPAVQTEAGQAWRTMVLRRIGLTALVLSILGYAVWILMSNVSPSIFVAAVLGEPGANYELRDSFDKVPGVTSFMNLAPWWFVWIGHKVVIRRERLTNAELVLTAASLTAGLLRGFAVNERRVIFELILPAIIFVLLSRPNWPPKWRRLLLFAPVIGIVALAIVFVSTEYFRSWVNYWQGRTSLNYLQWALTRLGGYYATALNNGYALVGAELHTSGALSISGITKLPVIGGLLGYTEEFRLSFAEQYRWALQVYTNREFNNPGGAAVALIDFGWTGGGILLFITGLVIGWSYFSAVKGRLFGTLVYLTFFFGLLEITRVFTFLAPAGLLNLLFIMVTWALVSSRRNRPIGA